MPTLIRLATNADAPGILDVVESVYVEYGFTWEPDGYNADLTDVEGHYFARGNPFWVAEVEGRVLGTVALDLFARIPGIRGGTTLHHEKVRVCDADCSVERLYVHPDARRMGLGSSLMESTITTARNKGRDTMEAWSDKRLTKAHRLYEKLGAQVVGERICHDPDRSPEWGFLLPL
ncbi:MAG: GNAT family N-acetyltransferase [Fimbriimonas ginsengisoli]|uniref:GNAT family N-acetyltransferase n=1 Tax=Fimbriimonas ginsengisoli TaxID=1005039 RepID=A0A931PWU7_FIMGI|nr:GNAT family N-acetyltransferase [Fimbriimonas ginsengisoli]